MRSSIACSRCRRSKVKCVNNGVNTTCKDCEAKGRECTYPTPIAGGGGGVPRRDSGSVAKPLTEAAPTGETPRRPKTKKPLPAPSGNVSTKDSMRAIVDALDSSVLTPKVWMELFEIYQLHFSVDLPFLHAPTFLKPLRQMTASGPQAQDFGKPGMSNPSTLPPVHPLLLLGFLTLTARFHPQLVAHHSPPSSNRPSNPLVASEYYASALKARISGNFGDGLGQASLARVQAMIMIAIHEWGHCEGSKAFISLGVAIRYSQLLGLQYQDDLDDEPLARSIPFNPDLQQSSEAEQNSGDDSDAFIEEEIRRRTFWACFILDRYLSNGKHRPQMLRVGDLRVQLPVSERAFLFGDKVRTQILTEDLDDADPRTGIQASRRTSLLLGANGDTRPSPGHSTSTPGSYRETDVERDVAESKEGRWEIGPSEGLVSRYIKAIDLYGKIARWSCAGGRRRERFPPWDPQSQWYQLHRRLESFRERLPRDFAFSQANVSAHLSPASSGSSTPYILLHTTLLLSDIILHRDYIPFIPLRCTKPQGPLDSPLFPPDEYQIPPQWWEQSATELFKSARDLINLLHTSREWGDQLMTPLVGFGLYTAAFVGCYSNHFHWMDQNGYLCKKPGSADSSGFEASRQSVELLGQMRPVLKLADGWLKTIIRVHQYFKRIKKDFERNSKHLNPLSAQSSPNETVFLGIRDGGFGGGLEEYKLFERTLRDFGSLDDGDTEMVDAPEYEGGRAGSSVASVGVKSEGVRIHESSPESAATRPDRWNAINNAAAAANPTEPTANGSGIAHYHPPAMSSGVTTPSQPNAFPPNPYSNPSSHTSPLVSPATYGQGNFVQYPLQQTSVPQSQSHLPPMQAQAQAVPPPLPIWTPEMRETWLNALDTTFTGDDVVAFVEGRPPSSPGCPGWLTKVWAGPSEAM